MPMIVSRPGRLITVIACLFAVGLAACGGSSSKSSSSTATTATTTAGGSTAATATGATTASGSSSGASSSSGGNFNACSLLSTAKLSTLAEHPYTSATPKTIANGQDACTYSSPAVVIDLTVILYQSNSGVTFDTMKSIQTGVGAVTDVSGVGDKAIAGAIELDIQAGDRLVAIQAAGAGGNSSVSIAVGKAIVAALG